VKFRKLFWIVVKIIVHFFSKLIFKKPIMVVITRILAKKFYNQNLQLEDPIINFYFFKDFFSKHFIHYI